jgi:glutathione S-transferase
MSTCDPLPVLYSFRRCPYAMRARMALHVAGIAVEIREVVLRDKPPSLRAVSPKATVPVLLLPDGRVLEESLDIAVWALQQHDPDDWLACLDDSAVRPWITRNDVVFKPLLDRYKYASRHPELSQPHHRDAAVQAYLSPLEAVLQHQPFLCGARPGWVDAAVFPFVRQFAMVEPSWFGGAAQLPQLRRWLDFWLGSAPFAAIMGKHPAWVDPAAGTARSNTRVP